MMKKMLFPFKEEFFMKRNGGNTKYHPPIKIENSRCLAPDSFSLSLPMLGISVTNDSVKRDEGGEAGPSSVSCSVCLNAIMTLACGHRFHLSRRFFHLLILLEKHALILAFS